MSSSCGSPIERLEVIELGTRIALYSYAGCSVLLGFLTLISTGERYHLVHEDAQLRYIEKIVKHIKDVDQAVATSTMTGIALIAAALIHQHLLRNFTLLHAYIMLLLLWLIALTGMWFIIHAWVFDILRKDKRRMATFSFWTRIIRHSKWFTLHLSLLGGYGLYVTIRREDFGRPECMPWFAERKIWFYFLYGFAAFPVVNASMLFIITSFFVWVACVIVALFSRKGWRGQVDPVVFAMFWLLEYTAVLGGLSLGIEKLVNGRVNKGDVEWSFGSTLALTLVIVPLRLVLLRTWQMIYSGGHDEPRPRPRPGRLQSETQGLMSNPHSRESSGLNSGHHYSMGTTSTNNYGERPPSYQV